MFVNPKQLQLKDEEIYKCNKTVMRYLVYDCHFSILSFGGKEGEYYFRNNDALKEAIKNMPLNIKMLSKLW